MPEKLDKNRTVKLGEGGAEETSAPPMAHGPLGEPEETPAVPNRQKLMLAKKKRLLRQRRQVIPRSLR